MIKKQLGIIGGMGPLASAIFYERITESTKASNDQSHMNIIISSHATLPDRTKLILKGDGQPFLDAVEQDLKLMEFANVDYLAIPCNTAHYFYEQVQEKTSIPIIHMVEETMLEIIHSYGKNQKVGILATSGTIQSKVYEKYASKFGLELIVPNQSDQQLVMDAIYSIKAGKFDYLERFEQLVKKMNEQYSCVVTILACTELSLFELRKDCKNLTIDAMDVLVKQCITKCGYEVKE